MRGARSDDAGGCAASKHTIDILTAFHRVLGESVWPQVCAVLQSLPVNKPATVRWPPCLQPNAKFTSGVLFPHSSALFSALRNSG